MPRITMIGAMDLNRCIGKEGRIPWRLRAEMEHFVNATMGHVVVIGRKTYDYSLPAKFKPLPGRENVVLTRDLCFGASGCIVVHSVETVLKIAPDKEIFIIGGAEIYRLFLPCADRLLITQVNTVVEDGDAFFPVIEGKWNQRVILRQEADEKNQFSFFVSEYTRLVP